MKIFHISYPVIASMLAVSFVAGCNDQTSTNTQPSSSEANPESDHGHPHAEDGGHSHGAGPHGGTLADWGGGAYHVEFTVDHDKKEAAVYVLGSDEKSPTPIATDKILLTIKDPALQTELTAVPLEGESNGKSSRFVGTHDGLATVQEFEGTISGSVDGTPYAGNFKEEAHPEHGHTHGDADVE